jgi:hypothetical protein
MYPSRIYYGKICPCLRPASIINETFSKTIHSLKPLTIDSFLSLKIHSTPGKLFNACTDPFGTFCSPSSGVHILVVDSRVTCNFPFKTRKYSSCISCQCRGTCIVSSSRPRRCGFELGMPVAEEFVQLVCERVREECKHLFTYHYHPFPYADGIRELFKSAGHVFRRVE